MFKLSHTPGERCGPAMMARLVAAIPIDWRSVSGELVPTGMMCKGVPSERRSWIFCQEYAGPMQYWPPTARGVIEGAADEQACFQRGEWPPVVLFRRAGMTSSADFSRFAEVKHYCERFVSVGYVGELVFVSQYANSEEDKLREWVAIRMRHPYSSGKSTGQCGPHIEIVAEQAWGGNDAVVAPIVRVCRELGLPTFFVQNMTPAIENPFVAGLVGADERVR